MYRLSQTFEKHAENAATAVAVSPLRALHHIRDIFLRVLIVLLPALLVHGILAARHAGAEDAGAAGRISAIPDSVWANMQGKSFNPAIRGCTQRADLRLLTLPYRDFDGRVQQGQLIVHKRVAKDVRDIFVSLFREKSFAIAKMQLIDAYGGDDNASMADNNTSGYNCRKASGSTRLSSHARGIALDINPLINPFVWRNGTSPPGGDAWDTPDERKTAAQQAGIILGNGAITRAFATKGWTWGGTWSSSKDYQHFSADGH